MPLFAIKEGFGRYLAAFFADLVPNTPNLAAYVKKPLNEAILLAPSRMIDAAEEQLNKYIKQSDDKPTKAYNLPLIIAAFGSDYVITGRDYTRQIADKMPIILKEDDKGRIFKVRLSAADLRAQIAIFAYDVASAQSLAAQFLLFTDSTNGRRFRAKFKFAGFEPKFWVQLEMTDNPAMQIATEFKNLTILAIDLTLHAQIPFFDYPKDDAEKDGKGTNLLEDPSGYKSLQEFNLSAKNVI